MLLRSTHRPSHLSFNQSTNRNDPKNAARCTTDSYLQNARSAAFDKANFKVYVAAANNDAITVVDVSDVDDLQIQGSLSHSYLDALHGIDFDASKMVVYVAGYTADRLTAVDVSDGSAPSLLGSYYSAT